MWLGKHIMKLREYGPDATRLQLKDALLPDFGFLTKDEILYKLVELYSQQISNEVEISSICKSCGELITYSLNLNELLDYKQDWTIPEPSREITIEVPEDSPYYSLHEMCIVLGKDLSEVLEMEVSEFSNLEAEYHKTRFVFSPKVTIVCDCGVSTSILIDTLPGINKLCGN